MYQLFRIFCNTVFMDIFQKTSPLNRTFQELFNDILYFIVAQIFMVIWLFENSYVLFLYLLEDDLFVSDGFKLW